MARQVYYEVHVHQKGRWEIHARHDDAVPATEEAKTLDVLASIDEVKVVRDTYDTETGNSLETIVYRSPKGQKKHIASIAAATMANRRKRARSSRSGGADLDFSLFGKSSRGGKPPVAAKPQTFTTTLIKILLIILFGVTLAGLMAFGSIVFLRDTSFSS
ncbi:MAG TPA: hypothetical protein ENI69_03810, partial [Rhodospirillales bacterium]|nr:hypothetical protein [Rhodospirillales bacterium]